jgi:hypothetical protein
MADSKSYPKGSTDPIALARALAAAEANVRGTGPPERARPSAAEEADRTPNWNKWSLIPLIEAWQCGALWANIDPDKVRFIRNAWMAEGSVHRFDESQDFKDRVELVEANQYGALKTKGCPSGKVDLRSFAVWVREKAHEKGWPAPPELLAMADEHDSGEQKTPPPGEKNESAGRGTRTHNKRDTEARYHGWQVRINQLAEMHPTNNHSDLCRKLAKEFDANGPSFQTIRKNTRFVPS